MTKRSPTVPPFNMLAGGDAGWNEPPGEAPTTKQPKVQSQKSSSLLFASTTALTDKSRLGLRSRRDASKIVEVCAPVRHGAGGAHPNGRESGCLDGNTIQLQFGCFDSKLQNALRSELVHPSFFPVFAFLWILFESGFAPKALPTPLYTAQPLAASKPHGRDGARRSASEDRGVVRIGRGGALHRT